MLRRLYHTSMFSTKYLNVKPDNIKFEGDKVIFTNEETKRNLEIAVREIKTTSNVVAFPTETVYGLGGSALSDEAVQNIYKAKNRPADNPLIVHVSSIDQLKRKLLPEDYEIPLAYKNLIEKIWPGPLTILLPNDPETSPLSRFVTAGQNTFAVRMPNHPVARALIALSDTPLAAPSANTSTRPSPTTAQHVYHDLNGKIPFIIDGGACDVGLESTVVDGLVNPPVLLRPGGVSKEKLQQVGGSIWENTITAKKTADANEKVRTPGMKYRHYSPTAKVVLFINGGDGKKVVREYLRNTQANKIALLKSINFDMASEISPRIIIERNLGNNGVQVSRNLFAMLREVDELGADLILVEGISENDEGLAVMNRLSKAAQETIEN